MGRRKAIGLRIASLAPVPDTEGTMATILIRTESLELLDRLADWLRAAGHQPILTTSLAAAHQYLGRARRNGTLPAAIVTTLPPVEQAADLLKWHWLDGLRRSAAPAPVLLLARHPTLTGSPRPGSVILADPALDEDHFRESLQRLLYWPVQPPLTA